MAAKMIRSDSPSPIREQLREILLQEIRKGTFPAGGRIPSERELAQLYGISRASVRESIAELLNAGILFRTVGRGTFVGETAARMQTPVQGLDIAFLINDDIFHFVQTGYNLILRGVEAACQERGDRLLFKSLDLAAEGFENTAKPGGCIVVGGLRRHQLDRLKEKGIPLVLVDFLIRTKMEGVNSVSIEYAGGTRLAVQHLHGLGHEHIGFIGFASSDKYNAYWQALEEFGLRYDPRWVEFLQTGDLEPGMLAGFHAMQNILGRPPHPTAMLVTNDFAARGVYEALGLAGVRVPDQMSVIGYDDLGVQASPPLTTIRADLDAVGRLAVEALYNQIERRASEPQDTSVPVEIVIRSSTAPLRDRREARNA